MFRKVNVLGPFLKEPGREFHLRQLAEILKVSPATVKSKISTAVRQKVILTRRERNVLMFSPNLDHKNFKRLLSDYNVNRIRASGLVSFLEDRFTLPCVVLFGSWAKGENRKGSDIDVFVMAEDKKTLDLSKFEKKLGAEIQLFVYSRKEIDALKRKSPELLNNIINGIKLSGFLEVF